EVTGLIADFQKANGLNATQFSDLLEQLSAQIDEMEEAVKELLGVTEEGVSGQITDVQSQLLEEELTNVQEQSADSMQHTPNGVSSADGQTTEAQVTDTDSKQPAEQMTESFTSVNAKDAVAESTQDSGQEEKQASQDGKSRQSSMMTADHTDAVLEQHADVFRETVTAVNDQVQAAGAETPQIQTYVELQHLMDQMEGLARVFASAEGNTVEMQLNPENLGKLVLTVTEKHGNVTAQIAASNEQVKEALQTQLVELRSTLQNQGIKIEAVEVTVATHEFEQNLDGNSSANGQMQEQADRQNGGAPTQRRNLDRNNLDELSGLMSEEETLAAQMMRDNGGTVDYTA
ncbi:MAG: flagellar hook-length control protein FliK, partial [Lachnospiraceae bacterium]|nr:flagellar hook-length control protein FliK [bacterium]MDY5518451.1 flagellar hook-length control protein FliK [Lachnospiraceae bacterium]